MPAPGRVIGKTPALASALLWIHFAAQPATSQGLSDQFLAEYPARGRAIEARLARVRGSCLTTAEMMNGELRRQAMSFLIKDDLKRIDLEPSKATRVTSQAFHELITCLSHKTSFRVFKEHEKASYRLDGFGERNEHRISFDRTLGRFLEAPYAIAEIPLYRLVESSDRVINSVEEVSLDGRKLVKVDISAKSPISRGEDGYTAWLDPQLGWAIRKSDYRPVGLPGASITTTVEYGEPRAIDTAATSVRLKFVDAKYTTCTFNEIVPFEAPDRDFQIETFGLTEPPRLTPASNGFSRAWGAVTLAMLLLGASIGLKKLAARFEKA